MFDMIGDRMEVVYCCVSSPKLELNSEENSCTEIEIILDRFEYDKYENRNHASEIYMTCRDKSCFFVGTPEREEVKLGGSCLRCCVSIRIGG